MADNAVQVKMPDVRGVPIRSALSLIGKMGLKAGRLTFEESKSSENMVLAQSVPAGAEIARGDSVHLTISGKSFIRLLPAVHQRADARSGEFLKRYLWIFKTILNSLDLKIEHIHEYFDPLKAPGEFFKWLASWFAVNIDYGISEAKLRMLVREAVTLFRWRGTALGLRKMLEIITGIKPSIVEGSVPIQEYTIRDGKFMGQRMLDNSIIDEKTSQHLFTVLFPVYASELDVESIKKIHQIIREEKPAHADYFVLFRPREDKRKQKNVGIGENVIDNNIVF